MAKARILAVDDQRYFRELLEGLISEEGYSVRMAASGEEALHVLEREQFDVVLTDLVMPGLGGAELVERIKADRPEQDIVIVTGVVDVKTAVEAMKLGVTDYILKPFDRATVKQSLDTIVKRRRLRDEHARLMAENLEYGNVVSLYQRVAGLFSTVGVEALAERIVEGLCLETRARAGIVWAAEAAGDDRLVLVGVRGIVGANDQPEEIDASGFESELSAALEDGRSIVVDDVRGSALYVPLRHGGSLLGIARLTAKLDEAIFGDDDLAAADRFTEIASTALANALRFRALERHSLRAPGTGAYTHAYFQQVVQHETQKAARFGQHFSLLRGELGQLARLRREMSPSEFGHWLEQIVHEIGRTLRTTDLLATESDSRFQVLLPETDALGAALLKQRIEQQIENSEAYLALDESLRPQLALASASYPSDGTQLESLAGVLERRVAEQGDSPVQQLDGEDRSFADALEALIGAGEPQNPQLGQQATDLICDEIARRPADRCLLFARPGRSGSRALIARLGRLAASVGNCANTEIIVIDDTSEAVRNDLAELAVTWVDPARLATDRTFLFYCGDGPSYCSIGSDAAEAGPSPSGERRSPCFHSSDRSLAEHLAFRLQSELGLSAVTL